MSSLNLSKTQRIDVRATVPVKQLLQEAARSCHKSVNGTNHGSSKRARQILFICS